MREAVRETIQGLFVRCDWRRSGRRMDKNVGANVGSRHMRMEEVS